MRGKSTENEVATGSSICSKAGGVRTGIATHCGCRIFKMAAKLENFVSYKLRLSTELFLFRAPFLKL